MSEAVKTPIDPGMIGRLVRGIRYAVSGAAPNDWFSPQQPLEPFAQEQAKGRAFDYPVGYNVNIQPRAYEAVSFAQLRALADGLDILRLVIETRKDALCKLDFAIKPRDPEAEPDARCEAIRDFLRFPDREHTWDEWLRMLLEDLFVIDAPTIYPRMTLGGKLYALEPVDGATIKRVIDGTGRTPTPPEVAYQQILKGVPAVDYSRDELIYRPRNLRTNRLYGYSPTEQILMTVNIALRRQVYQLQYYTEGSTPDLIMQVPETWSADQVKQFSDWWNGMLSGNTAGRRRTMFVPGGVDPVNTKEGVLKDEYDEWLTRVICFAFSISPQGFVAEMNRATAQTSREMAIEEGLAPIMAWVKNLIDYVIWRYFGYADLQLSWTEEKDPDPLQQAQINQIYINAGVKTANEVREEIGLEAFTPQQEAQLAQRKATAIQGLPGGRPPDDDTGKVEKASKKALRVLAPLNRQRETTARIAGLLEARIATRFELLREEAADQLAGVVSKEDATPAERAAREVDLLLHLSWEGMVAAVLPLLSEMAVDGADQALKQIGDLGAGVSLDLVNEEALAWARMRAAEMVGMRFDGGALVPNPNARWRIDETTRNDLRGLVTKAIEEGWSNDELAKNIREAATFDRPRARMIARTETRIADTQGNMVAYRAAQANGIPMLKQWVTAEDDKVSPECAENGAAGPIPLDALFPSGVAETPQHPSCRCNISPVVVDDA